MLGLLLTFNMVKLLSKNRREVIPKNNSASQPAINKVLVNQEITVGTSIVIYLHYAILFGFGHFRVFLEKLGIFVVSRCSRVEPNRLSYVPLFQSFEHFFKCYVYRRICDIFNRPICSAPSAEIILLDRVTHDHGWTFENTGTTSKVINMGSYNYLGFSESKNACVQAVEDVTKKYASASASPCMELGSLDIHNQLENLVARFLGVEDAIAFGMGFATNSLNLPTLMRRGCLILRDELNHASLNLGSRLSGAVIKVFKHNNMKDLEQKLRDALFYGQPRTHRPWKKILVVVEGVYSMEGTIVNLPEVIRLKTKYKAYLYLDEAHSVGALGPNGRGVTDYWRCDPLDVDIMMGTFTKSFGAAGGYIAGSRKLINYLRTVSHASCYATSMSAPVAQQVISTMRIIMGKDGQRRIQQLATNTRYFRQKLLSMGFIVYGDDNSPVVPLMQFLLSKSVCFSRMALAQGIALSCVEFPATPLGRCRARFCMSASHTKEMLDKTLATCDRIGNALNLKYFINPVSKGTVDFKEDWPVPS